MKKTILFLIVVFLCFGCKKETSKILTYPKTSLPGTNWKSDPDPKLIVPEPILKFIKFNSATSVTITTTDLFGGNSESTTGTCIINIGEDNMDSFEIDLPNGESSVGFTTASVNQIIFEKGTYSRVN